MALARSWLGSVVRLSSLTLLVPAGLLLAVAVAATVGGAGSGVGQLGQLFAGPGIPPATIGAPMPAERTGGLTPFSQFAPAVPVTASTQVRVPALPQRGSQAPRRDDGQRARRRPRRRVVVPSPTPPRANPQPAPAPAPPPEPAPPAPPPRPRPPSLVRQVGNQLKQIVGPLPRPLGPVAADAVDTVIDLLDPAGRTKPLAPVSQAVGSLLQPR